MPPASSRDPVRDRSAMVQRLRGQGGFDERVLLAMASVPREAFLPERWRPRAYDDRAVPIGYGQSCSQPQIVAAVLTALRLRGGERALEVGLGCGYQAAVLRAAGVVLVIGVEWLAELATAASATLRRLQVGAVEVRVGDGGLGAPDRSPFDVIAVSAAAPAVPHPLLAQLARGGRLVAPLREGPELDRLWLVRRRVDGALTREPIGPCRFVPLRGAFGGGGASPPEALPT